MKQALLAGATAALFVLAPAASQAGDIDGAYLGVEAGGIATLTTLDKFVGVYGGYNMRFGQSIIAGAEAEATFDPGTSQQTYTASGRIGYEVIEDGMVFAKAGAGFQPGTGAVWVAGIGVEAALPEAPVAARLGVDVMDDFAAGANTTVLVKGGLHYNF